MSKGENIYKRKDGRWEARYEKYRDESGKIKYGYCYGKSYKEVKEKVNLAKSYISLNKQIPSIKLKKKLLSSFCDDWLELNRNKFKDSTYVKYYLIIDKYIKPKLGGYKIISITSELISHFSNQLLEENLSSKTVRDILSLLHSILSYSNEKLDGTLPIVKIVYPKTEKKELRVLEKSEQYTLVNYLYKDMDIYKFAIILSLNTGLRIGEICGLQWKDISFKNKTISIHHTVQRVKNMSSNNPKTKLIIGSPKSKSSIRTIPLNSQILKLCRKYYVENPNAFVLTGTEKYLDPRYLQRKTEKYLKDCHIKNAHFHTFRHTFATRCVEYGFDIKTLSDILGHASTVVTMDRYVHPNLEMKRKNMKKLDSTYFYVVQENSFIYNQSYNF